MTWLIRTVEAALLSIDVAYHMNHRLNGELLYDARNGIMKEGIGHYGFEKISPRSARMVCVNPYPCQFDRGIIEATAEKFKPVDSALVTVRCDGTRLCRDGGADSCAYLIEW